MFESGCHRGKARSGEFRLVRSRSLRFASRSEIRQKLAFHGHWLAVFVSSECNYCLSMVATPTNYHLAVATPVLEVGKLDRCGSGPKCHLDRILPRAHRPLPWGEEGGGSAKCSWGQTHVPGRS